VVSYVVSYILFFEGVGNQKKGNRKGNHRKPTGVNYLKSLEGVGNQIGNFWKQSSKFPLLLLLGEETGNFPPLKETEKVCPRPRPWGGWMVGKFQE
jgi:hypothetical protein